MCFGGEGFQSGVAGVAEWGGGSSATGNLVCQECASWSLFSQSCKAKRLQGGLQGGSAGGSTTRGELDVALSLSQLSKSPGFSLCSSTADSRQMISRKSSTTPATLGPRQRDLQSPGDPRRRANPRAGARTWRQCRRPGRRATCARRVSIRDPAQALGQEFLTPGTWDPPWVGVGQGHTRERTVWDTRTH